MREDSSKTQSKDEESLNDISILNDENLVAGVPAKLFWGGFALSASLIFVMRSAWYIGVIIGFIYFMLLFMMHKDNPNAARGWQRALRRPTRWRASYYKKRNIIHLNFEE